MKDDDYLYKYLKSCKEAYSSDDEKKELARRMEWAVVLSEECYHEELERAKSINALVSSLLVASTFLGGAFITFVMQAKSKKLCLDVMLSVAGSFFLVSFILQLILVFYKRRVMSKSVKDIVITYLDKATIFANDYSENFGRLLSLDKYFNSQKRNNNINAAIEGVAVALLCVFAVLFFACLFIY